MRLALKEAKKAFKKNEVPIGAVITYDNKLISRAHNLKINHCNPCSHAEIIAIKKACKYFKDWRLIGTSMYVTCEPCLMCCGAIIEARIDRVVFGSYEYKMGAVVSIAKTFDIENLHHKPKYLGEVLKDDSIDLMQKFFKNLRLKNNTNKINNDFNKKI